MPHRTLGVAGAAMIVALLGSTAGAAPIGFPETCRWDAPQGPQLSARLFCVGPDGLDAEVERRDGLNPDSFASARRGEAAGLRAVGTFYRWTAPANLRDIPMALEVWERAADLGDAVAARHAGQLYLQGTAGKDKVGRGVQLLIQAGDKGDARAMFLIGLAHHLGTDIPADDAIAAHWWRRGAEAGDADAMYGFAWINMAGRGVPKDEVAAVAWYVKADAAGQLDATVDLGVAHLLGRGVAKDEAAAVALWRKAAAQNNARALQALADAYERGIGAPRDRAEAKRLRTQAEAIGKRPEIPTRFASRPTAEQTQLSYPMQAMIEDVPGTARLTCTVAPDHSLANCRVMSENPEGWGFGQAALSLAPYHRMEPGMPVGRDIVLPVVYVIEPGGHPPELSDQCAAYALALRDRGRLGAGFTRQAEYWIGRSRRFARDADSEVQARRLQPARTAIGERIDARKDRGFLNPLNVCELR